MKEGRNRSWVAVVSLNEGSSPEKGRGAVGRHRGGSPEDFAVAGEEPGPAQPNITEGGNRNERSNREIGICQTDRE